MQSFFWLYFVAAALLAVGLWGLWRWRKAEADMALMDATETTPAGAVAKMPAGSVVEVKGTLRCASPLLGEYSQKQCAYYAVSVSRHYARTSSNSKGRRQTTRGYQTVSTNLRHVPFVVEDSSGSVAVNPERGEIEGIQSSDRYEPYESSGVLEAGVQMLSNDRTLGHRYVETHLPLDIPVYVLGVVREDGSIGAPGDGSGHKLTITHKSEEERRSELRSRATWMKAAGFGGLVVGAAMTVYALAAT